jgi:hypothetical protein
MTKEEFLKEHPNAIIINSMKDIEKLKKHLGEDK